MKGPVLLNFTQKKALVIGAGKVGLRRAETLAGYGCFVTCISLDEFLGEPKNLPIKMIFGSYDNHLLKDVDLVVAATNDTAVNAEILRDCKQQKIWCNAVDDPDHSDFIFPSVVKRGDLTLSVCTDGASPFLATQIKNELAEKYDESYNKRLRYLKILRKKILELALPEKEKRFRLQEMTNWTLDKLQEEVEKI
ncbi:MAG: bifunctional precorrin-2 dehydrogenase/sirohydrochlorin ferrochelatase [Eubacterium sp.]